MMCMRSVQASLTPACVAETLVPDNQLTRLQIHNDVASKRGSHVTLLSIAAHSMAGLLLDLCLR